MMISPERFQESLQDKSYLELIRERDNLHAFASSIKDLIDTAMEMDPPDRGIDYLLGTYLRAINDAYEVITEYTDKKIENLKKRIDVEFPPDPEKKGTTYFRKRKGEADIHLDS